MANLKRSTAGLMAKRIQNEAQLRADSLGVAERRANFSRARHSPSRKKDQAAVAIERGKLIGVTSLARKIGYKCSCPVVAKGTTKRNCKCTKMRRLPVGK